MRTISNVLFQSDFSTQELVSRPIPADVIAGVAGEPIAQKSTPRIVRVPRAELELTYMYNPTIFNGLNKIVQTIMSTKHEVVSSDPAVQEYFTKFLATLGNSGSDITWEELLAQIFKYQCIYGMGFVENIFNKKGNRIVDWDLVDPKKIDYAYKPGRTSLALDKYGKPLGYTETLPMDITVKENHLPSELASVIQMPPNSIFLSPKSIAHIKLFSVGDGFYPIGLVEPIYKDSLRKMNIEEALANSIWRHGFPTTIASVGDTSHEPTPQQITNILNKLKDINYKKEFAVPYYYKIQLLESQKAEKLAEYLLYFKEQEVAGMGIPKPFATGGGEATNRATLGNQLGMFQLTLKQIIDQTSESIKKQMFRPLCLLEGFKAVPEIKWQEVGAEELDKKAKRLLAYVQAGLLKPEEIKDYIKSIEKIS